MVVDEAFKGKSELFWLFTLTYWAGWNLIKKTAGLGGQAFVL
jgi:hypothetical protein